MLFRSDEVVVRAAVQPGDALLHPIASGQDQDRQRDLARAPAPEPRQPVATGKTEVEHACVVARRRERRVGLAAGAEPVDDVAELAQAVGQRIAELVVVLNDQDANGGLPLRGRLARSARAVAMRRDAAGADQRRLESPGAKNDLEPPGVTYAKVNPRFEDAMVKLRPHINAHPHHDKLDGPEPKRDQERRPGTSRASRWTDQHMDDEFTDFPYKSFTITAWGEPRADGRFEPRAEVTGYRSGKPYGSFDENSGLHPTAREAARSALGHCMNLIDDDDL